MGLILCAEHGGGVAKYALEGLPNKVLAARYRTALPSETLLVAEMARTERCWKAGAVPIGKRAEGVNLVTAKDINDPNAPRATEPTRR